MTRPSALIIEDDPQLGRIFTLALQNDFDTHLCADGLVALSHLEQASPDLVVLDLHLPGASGHEILAQIRATPRLSETRVILATADHIQADMLEAQAEIALLKPISPLQLRELAVRLCQA